MTINKIPTGSFIVVGTGEGASFFRNCGTAHKIALESEGHLPTGNFAGDGSGTLAPMQSVRCYGCHRHPLERRFDPIHSASLARARSAAVRSSEILALRVLE